MALMSVDSCKVREGFGEEDVVNKANGGAAGLKHWVGNVNRIEGQVSGKYNPPVLKLLVPSKGIVAMN